MLYKFKMVFPKKKNFVREYELIATQSLYDFHLAIQRDLDYDEAQMVAFYTADENWAPVDGFTLFPNAQTQLMDEVSLRSLIQKKQYRFLYYFDLINKRAFQLEWQDLGEEKPRILYPRRSDGMGDPPVQFREMSEEGGSVFDDALPDVDWSGAESDGSEE